jgi:IS30 family transposase
LSGVASRGIAPAVRRRALLALTLREREEISRGLASGSSFREIAKCLKRAVSTVSREVARHGGRPAYRASQADGEAWQSALRPKRCLLSINLKLRDIVASKLILDWSPQQISGWLKPSIPMMRACGCPTKPFTEACSFKPVER